MPLPSLLLRGAAVTVAGRVLTLALGLVLLVVVARMGPTVQGAFALFVAVEGAMLTLCSGLGLLLARELSHRGTDAAPLLRSLLMAAFFAGLAAAVVLLVVAAVSTGEPFNRLWLLALAAPFILWVPTVSGWWLGQGQMGWLALPPVASPAAMLLLLLAASAALSMPAGVMTVLVAWVVGKALVGAISAGLALRQSRQTVTARAPQMPLWTRERIRFVATVGLSNVISLLNLRATLFLLEHHRGLAEAGVYSVAVQLAELLWVLSAAVSMSAYHRMSGHAGQAAELTLAALRAGLGLALLAAPVLGAVAWFALPPALGSAYLSARLPLALLLPGVAIYAAASSLSAYYTNFHGRPMWSAGIAGLSLALTLLLALWTVPVWGAVGAAAATACAYGLTMVVALRSFLRGQGWGWRVLWRPAIRQSAP